MNEILARPIIHALAFGIVTIAACIGHKIMSPETRLKRVRVTDFFEVEFQDKDKEELFFRS